MQQHTFTETWLSRLPSGQTAARKNLAQPQKQNSVIQTAAWPDSRPVKTLNTFSLTCENRFKLIQNRLPSGWSIVALLDRFQTSDDLVKLQRLYCTPIKSLEACLAILSLTLLKSLQPNLSYQLSDHDCQLFRRVSPVSWLIPQTAHQLCCHLNQPIITATPLTCLIMIMNLLLA